MTGSAAPAFTGSSRNVLNMITFNKPEAYTSAKKQDYL